MTETEAEAYLANQGNREDRWLLEDQRPWWKVSQLEGQLFGLTAETIRAKLVDGTIPGGVLLSVQAGWSVPRSGLLVYVATVRRQQGQHTKLA